MLPGRDETSQLEPLGPSDIKYAVNLKVSEEYPATEELSMSWGMIEQVRQQEGKGDVTADIDELVEELINKSARNGSDVWPFIIDDTIPETRSPSTWKTNVQPKTDIRVRFSSFHPVCNTLVMEIRPWCIIVNQLGIPLVLKESINAQTLLRYI